MNEIRDLIGELTGRLSAGCVISSAAERRPFETDWRGLFSNPSELVLIPRNVQEVVEIVRACGERNIAIVPQGGNTGLVAGAVPIAGARQVIVNMRRMNAIREIDVVDNTMTVEAGVVLQAAQEAALQHERLLPLSLGAEGTCQIGGNIATNAGGVHALAYGTMRGLVLGLEVVLPDGRIWNGLRSTRKDNTGIDLKQLFIGSEGTLGIITAAIVRLVSRPRHVSTMLIAVPDPKAALHLFTEFGDRFGGELTSFEYFSRFGLNLVRDHIPGLQLPLGDSFPAYVLCELSTSDAERDFAPGLEAIVTRAADSGFVLDAVVAQSEAQRQNFWHLRESLPEGERAAGGAVKHDVAVPISKIPDVIRALERIVEGIRPGSRIHIFGHIGDGNLHVNVLPPVGVAYRDFSAGAGDLTAAIESAVMDAGGTFSAEHGIGQVRTGALIHYRTAIEIDLMRTLKVALDPAGIMNPGKILTLA